MKNLLIIIVLLFFLSFNGSSQLYEKGLPYITNFTPSETGGGDQNWAVVQDKRGIMYFGNNDNGILEYDGSSWRSIPIANKSIVRSLAIDEEGTVYAGGVGEFGFLQPDEIGRLEYVSLSERLDSITLEFTDVWKTFAYQGQVWFCSQENTYIYTAGPDRIQVIPNEEATFMSHMVNGILYHSNVIQGLLVQNETSTSLIPGGEYFSQKYITCILPLSEDKLFIGTAGHSACILNPVSGRLDTSFIEPDLAIILKEKVLYQGVLLGGGKLGLSTLFGGFYIIDSEGKLIQKLGKESGLQDEQVICAYVNPDNPEQSPLWLALNIGISKAEINSPIMMFGELSGLSGSVNDIIRFNGLLYVATSSGIYYLKEGTNGIVEFLQIEGLSTQCWAFTIFTPPKGGMSRLFIASITGLHEIIDGTRTRSLESRIQNKTSEGIYYLYTHVQSKKFPSLLYLAGESFYILRIDGSHITEMSEISLQDDIRSLVEDDNGDIWLATSRKGVSRISISDGDTIIDNFSVEQGLPSADKNQLFYLDGELFLAGTEGIYRFDENVQRFFPDTILGYEFHKSKLAVFRMMKDKKDRFWVSFEKNGQYGEAIVSQTGGMVSVDFLPFYRLPNKQTDAFYDDDETVWIGKSAELYRYYDDFIKDYSLPFLSLVRQVTVSMDSIVFYGTDFQISEAGRKNISFTQNEEMKPAVKYSFNNFIIKVSASFFENENSTLFRYWLEGSDPGWTLWSDRDEFIFSNLSPGRYRLNVQAKNIYGMESETAVYEFTVLPPWYQTILAYVMYLILLVLLITFIVKLYTRRLVSENIKLEGIILERTKEIRKQKEELTDSIEYASRIQQALLPSQEVLREELPEHFILFKPRDIVSGDFYWIGKQREKIIIVAADCTGHGVPGAFMSMLGISYLNEVVNTLKISEPNLILDELKIHVMESLKQTGEEENETKDGMDLALMVIDKKNMKLQFSGAYNQLYYIRPLNEEELEIIETGNKIELKDGAMNSGTHMLEQLNGDKMPIGISAKTNNFSKHEIDLKPGYSLYINSDGYIDQFGGPKGKKFMSRSFKKLLLEIHNTPMQEQGKILDKKILEWQGDIEQIDDIIVFGVRI